MGFCLDRIAFVGQLDFQSEGQTCWLGCKTCLELSCLPGGNLSPSQSSLWGRTYLDCRALSSQVDFSTFAAYLQRRVYLRILFWLLAQRAEHDGRSA
jgi:hypothetical protein